MWYPNDAVRLPGFTNALPDFVKACDDAISGGLTAASCQGLLQRGLAVGESDTVDAVLTFAARNPNARDFLFDADEELLREVMQRPVFTLAEDDRVSLVRNWARHQTATESEAQELLGHVRGMIKWGAVSQPLLRSIYSEGWLPAAELVPALLDPPDPAAPAGVQPLDVEAAVPADGTIPWTGGRIAKYAVGYAVGNTVANAALVGMLYLSVDITRKFGAMAAGEPWEPMLPWVPLTALWSLPSRRPS